MIYNKIDIGPDSFSCTIAETDKVTEKDQIVRLFKPCGP